ncbi:hypothetical protein CH63R_02973 [Colletotrichum higginsianum IMI 349063]|uniref:Uncharacterized protein n=1 Tax=Colletotrichum higginsianum (strain IMI 349063) TaxID=759273 RepID=A0A1B7YQC7_COLHI|nr:hypothetical protein CH63R_02973 [Colletotrichum higginsianum IMI 349063]OBR14247.1 hypothetical protein CH63R_02973 [Colletotrichum higginsianum IMI 349063]
MPPPVLLDHARTAGDKAAWAGSRGDGDDTVGILEGDAIDRRFPMLTFKPALLCTSTGQPARCRFIGDDFAMVFLLRAQRGLTTLPSAITVPSNCFFE